MLVHLFLGMYHSGMGQTQIESFLSTIGVPTMHHKTMKTWEREILPHVAEVAESSCNVALSEEKETLLKKARE